MSPGPEASIAPNRREIALWVVESWDRPKLHRPASIKPRRSTRPSSSLQALPPVGRLHLDIGYGRNATGTVGRQAGEREHSHDGRPRPAEGSRTAVLGWSRAGHAGGRARGGRVRGDGDRNGRRVRADGGGPHRPVAAVAVRGCRRVARVPPPRQPDRMAAYRVRVAAASRRELPAARLLGPGAGRGQPHGQLVRLVVVGAVHRRARPGDRVVPRRQAAVAAVAPRAVPVAGWHRRRVPDRRVAVALAGRGSVGGRRPVARHGRCGRLPGVKCDGVRIRGSAGSGRGPQPSRRRGSPGCR